MIGERCCLPVTFRLLNLCFLRLPTTRAVAAHVRDRLREARMRLAVPPAGALRAPQVRAGVRGEHPVPRAQGPGAEVLRLRCRAPGLQQRDDHYHDHLHRRKVLHVRGRARDGHHGDQDDGRQGRVNSAAWWDDVGVFDVGESLATSRMQGVGDFTVWRFGSAVAASCHAVKGPQTLRERHVLVIRTSGVQCSRAIFSWSGRGAVLASQPLWPLLCMWCSGVLAAAVAPWGAAGTREGLSRASAGSSEPRTCARELSEAGTALAVQDRGCKFAGLAAAQAIGQHSRRWEQWILSPRASSVVSGAVTRDDAALAAGELCSLGACAAGRQCGVPLWVSGASSFGPLVVLGIVPAKASSSCSLPRGRLVTTMRPSSVTVAVWLQGPQAADALAAHCDATRPWMRAGCAKVLTGFTAAGWQHDTGSRLELQAALQQMGPRRFRSQRGLGRGHRASHRTQSFRIMERLLSLLSSCDVLRFRASRESRRELGASDARVLTRSQNPAHHTSSRHAAKALCVPIPIASATYCEAAVFLAKGDQPRRRHLSGITSPPCCSSSKARRSSPRRDDAPGHARVWQACCISR